MHKWKTRVLSLLLVFSLILPMVPAASAAESSGSSYFDFEASEYEVSENSGGLQIKIIRRGGDTSPVNVLVKAADFLSDYGTDYVILDENGSELTKVDGEKPDFSEFVYEDETPAEEIPPAEEEPPAEDVPPTEEEPPAEDAPPVEEEPPAEDIPPEEDTPPTEAEPPAEDETPGTESGEASVVSNDPSPEEAGQIWDEIFGSEAPEPVQTTTTVTKYTTGSPLLDAAYSYLEVPSDDVKVETETVLDNTLTEVHRYFQTAAGAEGLVHFDWGETEKMLTVLPLDNSKSDGSRVFMLALMGTDSEVNAIAANATTYVSILDDEPHETPVYELDAEGIVLTRDAPEAEITVRRTAGTQYFSFAYLSTVGVTADRDAYEQIENTAIAFVPSETEKRVAIRAVDFAQYSIFGLRLDDEDGNWSGYAEAEISPMEESVDSQLLSNSDSELPEEDYGIMPLANNITLGRETWNPDQLDFVSWRWGSDVTGGDGDNCAEIKGGDLYLVNENKGKHSMIYTKDRVNFTGITRIRFSLKAIGYYKRYTSYRTYVETDTDQTYDGWWGAQWTYEGRHDWKEEDLNTASVNDSLYFKFAVKTTGNGDFNKPIAQIDWLRSYWAKYSFSPQSSPETFTRKIYDFSTGTPNITPTYFDGRSERTFSPGITVKRGNDTVGAFYANNNDAITIRPDNEAELSKYGFYFKGVYFTSNGVSRNDIYKNGKYQSKGHYVEAKNGAVTVTPNQSFVKTLIDKGVLSAENKDETIKIYPVFGQDTVQVNFENADRDDSKSASKGKYDTAHLCSHFANILEAASSGSVKKNVHAGWLDYYSIQVPKYSVIRVKVNPAADRTPAGANWWYWDGTSKGVNYYEAGGTKFSGDNPAGAPITETDYTMADIVAVENFSVKPATGKQTFYVGYSPKSGKPDSVASLEGAVVAGELTDPNAQKTGSNGSMWLNNPFLGQSYMLTGSAPEGYYISWANLSGDANNNGTIEDSEVVTRRTDRNNSKNPIYVYGNNLNITLDSDNTRYYYQYIPVTSVATVTKTGSILREKNTFYRLANRQSSLGTEPVAGAYVNIAGFFGQTDMNGKYAVPIRGLPDWGSVSTVVSVDGQNYYNLASIENGQDRTVLPALERFTAKSVSARYANSRNSVQGSAVTVEDDTLEIKAQLTSSTSIIPAGARFFLYNKAGMVKKDCSTDASYSVNFTTSGDVYTATLRFNPKKDIDTGDTLRVQFCDQNGKYYPEIDMGYSFLTPLKMDEFLLPMIGSSSLADTLTGDNLLTDIIGNPLGDMDMGKISQLQDTTYWYAPEARLSESVDLEDLDASKDQKWMRADYTFGWSDKFSLARKKYNSEDEMKQYLKEVEDGTAGGKKAPNSKYATKGRFSWNLTPDVGFKLTLSQRSDNQYYFEDLVFFVGLDTTVSAMGSIQLPIGLSIVAGLDFRGKVVGVYRMYTEYRDPYEIEDRVRYDANEFGFFKKFNNSVRREGYIFLNPTVSVNLAIKVAIVQVGGSATFDFDMDFRFAESENYTYGDMKIQLDWFIKLVGFKVYSKKLKDWNIHLFNSSNQHGPINFDYALPAAMMAMSDTMSDMSGGEYSLDTPESRDYLDNRSAWTGGVPMARNALDSTTETELQTGTADNPQMSITKLNDRGELLMVFIGDDTSRSSVNKRAIFYSLYDGFAWSEPVLLDDDGTLDDYPNVFDLGDDRILVTWSSAEEVLPDGATVEDALKSLNIKASFFSKSSQSFDAVEQLTKTTSADYTADVLPRAAYSSETGQLILFYTKTEYDGLQPDLSNFDKAASVIAYLFYENGAWQNTGDVYADEELNAIADKETYREQWYGQRFLDARLDKTAGELLRIVDTTAISYQDLALYAWTVDWDGTLDTDDDRDVFMQIYDFRTGEFTHTIRVTEKTGQYTLPQFARSDSATYLFYGAKEADSDHGEIRYLNVSHAISNDLFTLYQDGNTVYYELRYETAPAAVEDSEGNVVDVPGKTVWVNTDRAAVCDSISDYAVYVDEGGQMYLFWTESAGTSRQIAAAMYNGSDDDRPDGLDDDSGSEAYWSEPFLLADRADTYYTGVGASVIDGRIYIGSGRGSYLDESDTALVFLSHTPYSDVSIANVTTEAEHPKAGDTVLVTAVLANSGMLPYTSGASVTFTGGTETVTGTYTGAIPGGGSALVGAYLTIPEDFTQLTFTAVLNDGQSEGSCTLTPEAVLEITDSEISSYRAEGYTQAESGYTASITNSGNAAAGDVVFTASSDGAVLGSTTVSGLAPGETRTVALTFEVPDSLYTLSGNIGSAPIQVSAGQEGETVFTFDGYATKEYDAAAVEYLKDASVANGSTFTMKSGEEKNLQPTITSSFAENLKVEWQSSSDTDVAYIDRSNAVIADKEGTAVLTGILVPKGSNYQFDANGNAEQVSWREKIPANQLITVTAAVTVTNGTVVPPQPDNPGGSGGSSQPNPSSPSGKDEPSTPAEPTPEPTPDPGDSRENPFTDVSSGAYYYDAVLWAAANGVTTGTSPTTFGADANCTRAQIVTFLWRAAGSPKPQGTSHRFTDVAPGAYYEEAMLWAVENGITTGTSETTFSPEQVCTRAQAVTFLYRTAGSPAVTGSSAFTDVAGGAYYANAVQWAVQQNITNGTSTTTFGPDGSCLRGQIVTFLYRYFAK